MMVVLNLRDWHKQGLAQRFLLIIAFALTDNSWRNQRDSESQADEVLQVMEVGPGEPMTWLKKKFEGVEKLEGVAKNKTRKRGV